MRRPQCVETRTQHQFFEQRLALVQKGCPTSGDETAAPVPLKSGSSSSHGRHDGAGGNSDPEDASAFLTRTNFKSIVEWLTAEAILNRPGGPHDLCAGSVRHEAV